MRLRPPLFAAVGVNRWCQTPTVDPDPLGPRAAMYSIMLARRREGGSVKCDVLTRGLRFGLVVGGVCALGWGVVRTAAVVVALALSHGHGVPSALVSEVILTGDSLLVGAALGLVLGATLAFVPGWLTSHGLIRRLLAGVVVGTL